MRNLILSLAALGLLALPLAAGSAQAQVDPNNPEHQFRGFAALAGSGARCNVSETLDDRMAQQFGEQMMGDKNDAARKAFNETYNQARMTDCADKTLVQLFALAIPAAMKAADGVALAHLDQGFCVASGEIGVMRLYATYRQANMNAKRKKDAEEARTTWREALKTGCVADPKNFNDPYPSAIIVWDFFPAQDGSCRSDWAKTAGPFECVYGKRPQGPTSYDDTIRFGRLSIRAAKAKAAALEIDKAKSCRVFSAAERAAGAAQMQEDARFGLSKFSTSSKALASNIDPEPAYATADEVAAAGRLIAGTCADLRAPPPTLPADAPATQKGEQAAPASGAARIRETMDRVAMMAASLPSCAALPNFTATKKAAEAYVAGMTPQRRLVAAAESYPAMIEIDKAQCDAAKLGAPFQASALAAVDALRGKWK